MQTSSSLPASTAMPHLHRPAHQMVTRSARRILESPIALELEPEQSSSLPPTSVSASSPSPSPPSSTCPSSSCTIPYLPTEIFHLIVLLCDRTSQSRLCRVSTFLRAIASLPLYKRLVLDSSALLEPFSSAPVSSRFAREKHTLTLDHTTVLHLHYSLDPILHDCDHDLQPYRYILLPMPSVRHIHLHSRHHRLGLDTCVGILLALACPLLRSLNPISLSINAPCSLFLLALAPIWRAISRDWSDIQTLVSNPTAMCLRSRREALSLPRAGSSLREMVIVRTDLLDSVKDIEEDLPWNGMYNLTGNPSDEGLQRTLNYPHPVVVLVCDEAERLRMEKLLLAEGWEGRKNITFEVGRSRLDAFL